MLVDTIFYQARGVDRIVERTEKLKRFYLFELQMYNDLLVHERHTIDKHS